MKEKPCRIIVLISGSGTNLQALIDAVANGEISGTIEAVLSNRPDAAGLQRAQDAGIPTITLDHKQFPSREAFDLELQKQMENCHPDVILLAGFMRILSAPLVEKFAGKMLNIHPSLLPKYRGLNTHARALEAGDSEHGASVHFVTPDLDGGPVVLQAKLKLRPDHNPENLAQELLPLEHKIYPQVVTWFCDGKLKYQDNQLSMNQQPLAQPLLLNEI